MTEKNTPILISRISRFQKRDNLPHPVAPIRGIEGRKQRDDRPVLGNRQADYRTTSGLGLGKIRHGEPFAVHTKGVSGIKGFGVSNMWDMARFYTEYRSNEILQPLVGEISWSKHIVILTKCKEMQQRQFYILSTKKYGWTKDVLINKIEAKTYENYLLGQSNFDMTLPEKIKNQAILA